MILAEVFSMGIKAGVEPLALWEAVRTGASGRRRTFDRLYNRFLPNKYDPPSFALKLGHKDMRLARRGHSFSLCKRPRTAGVHDSSPPSHSSKLPSGFYLIERSPFTVTIDHVAGVLWGPRL